MKILLSLAVIFIGIVLAWAFLVGRRLFGRARLLMVTTTSRADLCCAVSNYSLKFEIRALLGDGLFPRSICPLKPAKPASPGSGRHRCEWRSRIVNSSSRTTLARFTGLHTEGQQASTLVSNPYAVKSAEITS